MLGLGGVPSLIMLCGLCFLPESPRWLITKGRMVAAKAVRPPSRCARPGHADSAQTTCLASRRWWRRASLTTGDVRASPARLAGAPPAARGAN